MSELESLFEGLRGDVDALFMQTPSVDQEGLCRQSEEMHRHLEEQARPQLCCLAGSASAAAHIVNLAAGSSSMQCTGRAGWDTTTVSHHSRHSIAGVKAASTAHIAPAGILSNAS